MIEPGRPRSLGRSEDTADAAGLLLVLQGCRVMRTRRHAGTTHVATRALWNFWELPRLPHPLISKPIPACLPLVSKRAGDLQGTACSSRWAGLNLGRAGQPDAEAQCCSRTR